jgi:hypothetical protein
MLKINGSLALRSWKSPTNKIPIDKRAKETEQKYHVFGWLCSFGKTCSLAITFQPGICAHNFV